jgi:serine phosphatase RsbU (regulator of sigma subunit)/Tfp pilus assembly protein PilF
LRAIDSLQKVVNSNIHDTLKLDALITWDNIIYQFNPDLDFELNQQMLEIAERGINSPSIGIAERQLYIRYKGLACNNIGLIYNEYGNYKEALTNFQISLEIAEYFEDSVRLGNATNNIGMIYMHMKMPEKAMEYYNRSITFDEDDPYSLATYHNNMGLVYIEMGDTAKAVQSYLVSLKYATESSDYYGKGNTLSNIGLIYTGRLQLDTAIYYFTEAISFYEEIDYKSGIAVAYKSIGHCHLIAGKIDVGLAYCEKAYKLAQESKSLNSIKESCNCLYHGYQKKGNDKLALHFLEEFLLYQDSLESSGKNQELLKLDFQYNLDKQRIQDSIHAANEKRIQSIAFENKIHKEEKVQYILFAGIGICAIAGVFIFVGYIRKKRDHEIIAKQKLEVETQKHIVEEKNKEITDSINYAKRIQEAILPGDSEFKNNLPESFILYKPKDIVAGDFYWLEKVNDLIIFAVADCTGHGVPGAMVSVVCHNALNRSVNEFKLTDPGKILDKTRELVVETFENDPAKNKTAGTIRDGMDISLCVYNKSTQELLFSGANNSLFLIRENELIETLADKQPIGKYAEEKPFTSNKLNLHKGDILYLYTDGYADQFGGINGKKFKYKQLKELLIKNANLPLAQQASILNQTFESWKGNLEQVDDVCLMGVLI